MELTDTPDNIPGRDETAPNFDEWESPEQLMRSGPIRERMLDVVVQLREPTTVATIADRVDCDTETAREYLKWFAEMGMVREHPGRPVRYERNESYLRWRRVEHIRDEHTDADIVAALEEMVARIEEYQERFDATSPDEVSLLDSERDGSIEERWEALSAWKTLERRAALYDAARRESATGQAFGRVDA